MSDDRIIDLTEYAKAREQAVGHTSPLALRGTDGERRRYALPLWRMAYLADARWAALVREDEGASPRSVVVLDLAEDPPRSIPEEGFTSFDPKLGPPAIEVLEGGTLILPLGTGPDEERWFVVVADRREGPPAQSCRDDLVFLAGECAGLLALVEVIEP